MRVLKRRGSATAFVLGLAVAASAFVFPAAASALEVPNACRNSVNANNSQIGVDTTATDTPDPVVPGGTVTLSNITQTANVPGTIFVAGYNLGLLQAGPNTVPATVSTFLEGTNTVEGVQQTPFTATSISTTISDPDGTPSTGDETATDGSFTVTYPDQTWTASGPSGSTIDFREDTRTPLSVVTGAEVGGVVIRAVVGGFLSVRFACSPGTVTPPDPGTVSFIDPADSFATTAIETAQVTPAISIDDVQVNEGDSGQTAANFTVSLNQADTDTVTVDFATSNGTATAPEDYTANSGTVTFAPGDTSETVTVQVNGDTTFEGNETFNVDLSNPTFATIADNQGVGTIVDDDPPPVTPAISIDNVSVDEGDSGQTAANFTVSLDQADTDTVTVDFATSNGTATAPEDYTANSGTVTFVPGDTSETVTVQVNGDTTFETDETFNVNLSNATNATIADDLGVGTIVNDDPPPVVRDGVMDVIVNGPTASTKTSKALVSKVTNDGTSSLTVCNTPGAGGIDWSVEVNGVVTGTVSQDGSCATLSPGASKRFKATWNYGAGALATGDTVDYSATVNVTDEATPANNTETETRTAK